MEDLGVAGSRRETGDMGGVRNQRVIGFQSSYVMYRMSSFRAYERDGCGPVYHAIQPRPARDQVWL